MASVDPLSLPPTPLQRVRAARRMSQATLARLSGVNPNTIGLAERSGAVTRALAARLAPALGCDPDDIIGRGEP